MVISERFPVKIAPSQRVTAISYAATAARRAGINFIIGHGAGAGQTSQFIVSFATALAERGIDTATFNFLYTEQGRRVPDRTPGLESCWRAVTETVRKRMTGGARLAIGGKSMCGRTASQVAAAGGAGELAGLVFLGYPLHPPGRPDRLRAAHLPVIKAPMLFVQGSRDPFGTPAELEPIIARLDPPAELFVVEGGDHSFKVPKNAPLAQADVFRAVQDRIETWLRTIMHR